MSLFRPWPTVPLHELVLDTQYGTSSKSNESGRGWPMLRMNNITYGGDFDLADIKHVELSAQEKEKLQLRSGDLLFNRTNSRELVGKTAVWEGSNEFTFAGYLIRVRLREDRVLPQWVSRFMNSPAGKRALFHMAKPSINMANISASDLLRFRVPVAPLEHQQRAISLLDKADAIRRKRKEAIALTEEFLRSAFLEMFGDPVTNPKGWEVKPLGEQLAEDPRIGTLVPADDDGVQLVVRVGELGDYDVALEKCKRVALEGKELERFRLEVGDVVLARAIGSEDHLGKASVLQKTTETVTFDSHVMRLRFRPQRLLPYFFVQWLRSEGGRHLFMREAGRTAVQFNVNGKQIARVAIPVPDITRQREFVELLQAVRTTRARHVQYHQQSDVLFSTLVHRAFRGELTGTNGAGKPQLGLFEGKEAG